MTSYQVGVIGGGPGGYVAGIKLDQLGISTVVFEKERLGGVCLNWGCIPTKAMVKVSEQYHQVQSAVKEGYFEGDISVDFKNVKERQKKIVNQLVGGIEHIYNKRNIDVINAKAETITKSENGFIIEAGDEKVEVEYIILATGSRAKALPSVSIDHENILSSRDIITMEELPKKLVVVGGGVVGCEFACIFNHLGVEVEVVEFLPTILPTEDKEVSRRLTSNMKKSKIRIHTKTAVESWEKDGDEISVKLSNGKSIKTEKVLLSVGRESAFNLKCSGFELETEKGFVTIDDEMRSNNKKIFAVGDLTGKLMLAHAASKQAIMASEIIAGEIKGEKKAEKKLEYINIPRCTFTSPEIGSTGYTEDQAKEKYGEIKVGKFMFSANGKALTQGETAGFVKVIACAKTHKIVGMHIIGPSAAELIAQAGIILGLEADTEALKKVVTAHPTLSEAITEAIEDIDKEAIHKI